VIGISVRKTIGIGDAVQFTSVPENYFKHTGQKLVDLNDHWVFDFNPYVIRGAADLEEKLQIERKIDLWQLHCTDNPAQYRERTVYLCNAEAHARHFSYTVKLNRPRLYRFEEFPFHQRLEIILHTQGKSHGTMPEYVVRHVLDKYGDAVRWIGLDDDWKYPLPRPPRIGIGGLWELAEAISKARMFIGVDSGPSWIAKCYPDVVVKTLRLRPNPEDLRNWVPLECCRLHSHWDDRMALIHNPGEDDAGFTWSYKRL